MFIIIISHHDSHLRPYYYYYYYYYGRDSVVGVATRFGLDGPRIELWLRGVGGGIFSPIPDRS